MYTNLTTNLKQFVSQNFSATRIADHHRGQALVGGHQFGLLMRDPPLTYRRRRARLP